MANFHHAQQAGATALLVRDEAKHSDVDVIGLACNNYCYQQAAFQSESNQLVKGCLVTNSSNAAISNEIGNRYVNARHNHAAWSLLASRRAPLVLGCLKALFDTGSEQVTWENAAEQLEKLFAQYANTDEYELPEEGFATVAQRELRGWIRQRLLVEREGVLFATDSLQKAFQFVDSLEDQAMTSTASRLSTVQREIESLESRLNPVKEDRVAKLRQRIAVLQEELDRAEKGEFEVLTGARAVEGIREVYQLAISLRLDFRRVEDSFREADRALRYEIIRSDQDRGSILNNMLQSHEVLLSTPEGRVFDAFYDQLHRKRDLDQMKSQIMRILESAEAGQALSPGQQRDIRFLVPILNRESERILQARARGENDVKSFMKSGIGREHHRVGALLTDIMAVAADIDWSDIRLRRLPSSLPRVGIGVVNVPVIERLRINENESQEKLELDLTTTTAAVLDDMPEDFWEAFDSLDRQQLFDDTSQLLHRDLRPFSLGQLAEALPPTHDLETLAYWIGMAREADVNFSADTEVVDITGDSSVTRFTAPLIFLDSHAIEKVNADVLG